MSKSSVKVLYKPSSDIIFEGVLFAVSVFNSVTAAKVPVLQS